MDLEIHQMDMDMAFLNADLKEEIYIMQPEGFINEDHPDYVFKLRKSLYGLNSMELSLDHEPEQVVECGDCEASGGESNRGLGLGSGSVKEASWSGSQYTSVPGAQERTQGVEADDRPEEAQLSAQ